MSSYSAIQNNKVSLQITPSINNKCYHIKINYKILFTSLTKCPMCISAFQMSMVLQ